MASSRFCPEVLEKSWNRNSRFSEEPPSKKFSHDRFFSGLHRVTVVMFELCLMLTMTLMDFAGAFGVFSDGGEQPLGRSFGRFTFLRRILVVTVLVDSHRKQ